ncbi:MAG: 50S ribosomal protein L4 [Chitinispirillaceae bacterium]|nr:50S ribosomal protein L4 [Chitinispirillaceae bacterium]
MKAKVYQQDGTVAGEVELPETLFAAEVKEHLLFQVLKGYRANRRQGTAKTKGRSEVSGGGRKPWRQKGTGRARAGSNTSPVWVRGGKAHGPMPRDYSTRLPKKMRMQALSSAFSSRAKEERIMIVQSIACDPPKSKTMAQLLNALSVAGQRTLLIVDPASTNLYRAGKNVKNLDVKPLSEVNAYDVLKSDTIIFNGEALVGKLAEAVKP